MSRLWCRLVKAVVSSCQGCGPISGFHPPPTNQLTNQPTNQLLTNQLPPPISPCAADSHENCLLTNMTIREDIDSIGRKRNLRFFHDVQNSVPRRRDRRVSAAPPAPESTRLGACRLPTFRCVLIGLFEDDLDVVVIAVVRPEPPVGVRRLRPENLDELFRHAPGQPIAAHARAPART